jgi:hypothetical protein
MGDQDQQNGEGQSDQSAEGRSASGRQNQTDGQSQAGETDPPGRVVAAALIPAWLLLGCLHPQPTPGDHHHGGRRPAA